MSSFADGPAPEYGPSMVKEIMKRCPLAFLVCMRSKNKNVVVYKLNVKDGKIANPPIDGFWLDVDPAYRKPRRAKGIRHDRVEFGFLDRTLAWKINVNEKKDTTLKVSFQLFSHPLTVKYENGQANVYTTHKGSTYLFRSMYIDTGENLTLGNILNNCKTLYFNGLNLSKKPPVREKVYLRGHA